jgi:hypothetical protein
MTIIILSALAAAAVIIVLSVLGIRCFMNFAVVEVSEADATPEERRVMEAAQKLSALTLQQDIAAELDQPIETVNAFDQEIEAARLALQSAEEDLQAARRREAESKLRMPAAAPVAAVARTGIGRSYTRPKS